MREPLDERELGYLVRQRKKGRAASEIAAELWITPRHARHLWAVFCTTGKIPVSRSPGRPKNRITEQRTEAVADSVLHNPNFVRKFETEETWFGHGCATHWWPTLFEEELMQRKIAFINSRPPRPQTNGKLGRFFRILEKEMPHFGHLAEFVGYYNERRPHYSLDMRNRQTPLRAFGDKRDTNAIRKSNPKLMEADTND